MTRHPNISLLHRRDHARATTPRGTCTAAEGLDVETFRGFQFVGELFLLTSFFIEPEGYARFELVAMPKLKSGTAVYKIGVRPDEAHRDHKSLLCRRAEWTGWCAGGIGRQSARDN